MTLGREVEAGEEVVQRVARIILANRAARGSCGRRAAEGGCADDTSARRQCGSAYRCGPSGPRLAHKARERKVQVDLGADLKAEAA